MVTQQLDIFSSRERRTCHLGESAFDDKRVQRGIVGGEEEGTKQNEAGAGQ